MSIKKAYEISCDQCNWGEAVFLNKEAAIDHWKDVGWIIKSDDRAFCDAECENKFKKPIDQ